MKESLVLIGGGGHCLSAIDVIESTGKFTISGILDTKEKVGNNLSGYKITGTDTDIPYWVSKRAKFLITAGQIKSPIVRINLYNKVIHAGGKLATLFSPKAYISKNTAIGTGTIIMNDCFVNSGVSIGLNCILNSKSLLEHNVIIGNHSHISTGAILNGDVAVGDKVFIGSGVVLSNGIRIASGVCVGAGSVVIRDILKKNTLFAGNPAHEIQSNN